MIDRLLGRQPPEDAPKNAPAESGFVFFYGTLADESTIDRFDTDGEHISPAVIEGLAKWGNNVLPPDRVKYDVDDRVEGHLYRIDDFSPVDDFENYYNYWRVALPVSVTIDGLTGEVHVYVRPVTYLLENHIESVEEADVEVSLEQ